MADNENPLPVTGRDARCSVEAERKLDAACPRPSANTPPPTVHSLRSRRPDAVHTPRIETDCKSLLKPLATFLDLPCRMPFGSGGT